MVRFLRKMICSFTLLKIGAFRVFFYELKRQIYSKDIQIGLEKNLENLEKNPIECPVNYNLRQASVEDINEAFQKIRTESRGSAYQLLNRRWLHECGCGTWFTARTTDTNDLCYFQCIISPEDNEKLEKGFRNLFPKLNQEEILFEGAYTFEKYRRNRIAGSIMFDLMEMYKNRGFKRLILYIDIRSESQIQRTEARGFARFEEAALTKTMLFHKRKVKPC